MVERGRVDHFKSDLRYGWRRLRRTPGFTIVAVLTLALGIGANTALFSLINGLLLKSTDAPGLDRLVTLARVEASTGRVLLGLSEEQRRAMADSGLFAELVLRDPLVSAMSSGNHTEVVSSELVSGNYFQILGIQPRAGRLLQPQDDLAAGAETPLVISERLWHRWFSADPSAIGRAITVADQSFIIVGIAPRSFNGTWLPTMLSVDAWLPVRVTESVRTVQGPFRGFHLAFATLRAGVSRLQASAAVEIIGRQLPGDQSARTRFAALPAHDGVTAREFDYYGLLLGSAVLAVSGLVLLIACANLANLFLARGAARVGELAIRRAIGASRSRLIRLLLTESVLVVLIAGGVSLVLVFVTTRIMVAADLPTLDGLAIAIDPTPDLRVFAYAFAMAAVATVAVGLVPARRSTRSESFRDLVSSGMGATTGSRRGHARLVGAQVAMSIVLLVAAGLYARSALKVVHFDPGYDVSGVAMASVDLRLHKLDEPRGRATLGRLLEAVRASSSVQYAALASRVPAAGPIALERLTPDGASPDETSSLRAASFEISSRFFETLRITLRRGRDFHDADDAGAPRVVIVSERVASTFWPGQDPIGRRVRAGGASLEVVGVAENTTRAGRDGPRDASFYVPVSQAYAPRMAIVVRGRDGATTAIDSLRQSLQRAAPDVAVFDVRRLADSVGLRTTPVRLAAVVLGVLGLLGFGIAMLGVYGVVASFVSQRMREFGVHKALGASPSQIHAMVLRQGWWLLVRGVIPGLIVAFAAAGLLRHLLYGVQPRDPVTFIIVPLAILVVGLTACYFPARRAARVDPNVALREL